MIKYQLLLCKKNLIFPFFLLVGVITLSRNVTIFPFFLVESLLCQEMSRILDTFGVEWRPWLGYCPSQAEFTLVLPDLERSGLTPHWLFSCSLLTHLLWVTLLEIPPLWLGLMPVHKEFPLLVICTYLP